MSVVSDSGSAVEIPYGYGRVLDLPFDRALEAAREALKSAGFGVLCEIDIRQKLAEKLGVDFRKYVILGVCNPSLAHQTLQRELHIGLLLPCNVIVYDQDGRTVVAAIDARRMMSIVGNPELESAAGQVNALLHGAIDRLSAA